MKISELPDAGSVPDAARLPLAGDFGGPATRSIRADALANALAQRAAIIATGSTTPRTLADRAADVVDVRDFGAVCDGVADDAPAINAAIAAVRARGGGTVRLAPLHGISSTVVPRSFVHVEGPSRWNVRTLAPFAQAAGSQWFGGSITGVLQNCVAGFEAATNCLITAAQWCEVEITTAGFNSAANVVLNISGAATTPGNFDYVNFPFGATSNTIWNRFRIQATLCGAPFKIKGVYGTVPTPSPAGSANSPIIVVTSNTYYVDAFHARASAELIGATDSEVFEHLFINMATPGMVALDIASDPAFPGNNYCNSHHFQHLMFSRQPSVTTGTLVRIGWSFGNHGIIEHDIGPDTSSGLTTLVAPNSISHLFQTKNTGNLGASNLLTMTLERGHYHRADNGFETLPTYGFVDAPGSGMFRATGGGEVAISVAGAIRALFGASAIHLGGNSANAPFRAVVNASNVNNVTVQGNVAGGAPGLFSNGADANPPLLIGSKGSGGVLIRRNFGGTQQTVFQFSGVAGVDHLIAQAGTGAALLTVGGSSANVSLSLQPKGTGKVILDSARVAAQLLPSYANEAAAKAAGLIVGDFYWNSTVTALSQVRA